MPDTTPGSTERHVRPGAPGDEGHAYGHLEGIRAAELAAIRPHFEPGIRVLEIGGGSGYQASLIASWGCDVESIDLAGRPSRRRRHFPVRDYDGRNILFPDASFDLVFSSNVLEHVEDLPALLRETRRVLTVRGKAVHVVPTPLWRSWSIAAHHPYLVKYLLGWRDIACAERVSSPREIVARGGLAHLLRRALLPAAHGAYPSALSELFYYRRARWAGVFRAGGFEIVEARPVGVFYTGYALLPMLTPAARRTLARLLGSAAAVFVLRADEHA